MYRGLVYQTLNPKGQVLGICTSKLVSEVPGHGTEQYTVAVSISDTTLKEDI